MKSKIEELRSLRTLINKYDDTMKPANKTMTPACSFASTLGKHPEIPVASLGNPGVELKFQRKLERKRDKHANVLLELRTAHTAMLKKLSDDFETEKDRVGKSLTRYEN